MIDIVPMPESCARPKFHLRKNYGTVLCGIGFASHALRTHSQYACPGGHGGSQRRQRLLGLPLESCSAGFLMIGVRIGTANPSAKSTNRFDARIQLIEVPS